MLYIKSLFGNISVFFWEGGGNIGIVRLKGWEATFLIRAFGLSGELSTEVGFAFQRFGPWLILS